MKKPKIKIANLSGEFAKWRAAEDAYWKALIDARIKELVPKVYDTRAKPSSGGN